jgi:hypothetical protein
MTDKDIIGTYSEFLNKDKRIKLLKWKISDKNLKEWTRLNKDVPKHEAYDCVINSLTILGVLEREIAEKLSVYATQLYATQQRAISDETTLDILNYYFEKNTLQRLQLNTFDTTSTEGIKFILNALGKNEYTIALFHRAGKVGHAVIISKKDNMLIVHDPQQERIHCETTDLADWINKNRFNMLSFIYSTKKANIATTRHNIIRKQTTEHTAKRKRIKSPTPPKSKSSSAMSIVMTPPTEHTAERQRTPPPKSKSSSAMSVVTTPPPKSKSSSAMSVVTTSTPIRNNSKQTTKRHTRSSVTKRRHTRSSVKLTTKRRNKN